LRRFENERSQILDNKSQHVVNAIKPFGVTINTTTQ
jgi:hypothetical protein